MAVLFAPPSSNCRLKESRPFTAVSADGTKVPLLNKRCLLYDPCMTKAFKSSKLKAVRLPDEYVTGLERIAAHNYESVSDVLRRAVRELIAREERTKT